VHWLHRKKYTGCANEKQSPYTKFYISAGSTHTPVHTLKFNFSSEPTVVNWVFMTNQTFHSLSSTLFECFSDECKLPIAHSVFKQSVQNVNQLRQHTIKLCYKTMIALISINTCSKSFYTVHKTIFQLGSVGQIWCISLIVFHHCFLYMIIHWHINLVHFLLFLH